MRPARKVVDRLLVNTAKIHSPLFRNVAFQNLARNRDQVPSDQAAGALKAHKEKLKHERWVKKKIRLDEARNFYVPRKTHPKKLRPRKITGSFSTTKSGSVAKSSKPVAVLSSPNREVLAEVVNNTPSTASGSKANNMATMTPPQPYRDESQISNILKCPDCQEDPPNLIEEFSSGDMVCASCGLVVRGLLTPLLLRKELYLGILQRLTF